MPHRFVEMLV